MAANFPDSPSNGDTFTSGALTFTWNGSAWKLDPSSGTKGEKGQKGEVGVTGDKGQKGQKGEVGDKGQKGEVGSTGGTGGTGQKGQKGEVGATGAAGAAAAKGQKGEEGDKGATGGTGGTGSTGDKGQKGEASTVKGDKGQKGELGTTGDKGATGAGDKGQKGEEGPQGGGAPVGQIVAWSGSGGSLPSGYFLCDGSAISRSTYAALFAIVGTTHGSGNGSSTFNIPDLRDRFIVGASNSTGDTSYPGVSPGATGGSANATLVSHSHTINNHTHSFSATTNNPGDHDHRVDVLAEFASTHGVWQTGGGYRQVHTGGTHRKPLTSDAGGHTHSISGTTGNPSNTGTNSQGSSSTNANLPPYYALAYIIQYAQGGSTAKGQKGEQGATGSGGSTGDKGQKGEAGDKGAASSVQGPTGDKGQKGEVGAQGTGGSAGSPGAKGQKGEIGAGGSAGSDGSDGDKGQKGEVGAGDKGQKGDVGAAGGTGPVAGSANQVVYKNSSNVATGSNNLTFDGNILKLPSTTLSDDGDGTYTVNGPHLQIGSNAANSLQFWHDSGSNLSGISEVGSGDLSIITNGTNLYIQKDATYGYAEDMIHCIANGAVKLFYNGGSTAKVETTSTGAKVNGNLEVTGTLSPSGMVVNARTSGYSLVASDAGKLVTMTTGDCSVLQNVFSPGNAVTVYNNSSSSFSILQGSGVTMYLSGTTSTGNRTLHQRGMATIVCVASNTFSIAGSGLS